MANDHQASVIAESGSSSVMNLMHVVNAISKASPLKELLYVNIRLNSA